MPSGIALGGDVTGYADSTTVKKLQGVLLSDTQPSVSGETLIYNQQTDQWEPGITKVDNSNILNKAALKSDGVIILNTDQTSIDNAVFVETTIGIKDSSIINKHLADNSVNSLKIVDNSIELTDIKQGPANTILLNNDSASLQWEPTDGGKLITNAKNGLTKSDNFVQLGWALTEPTAIGTSQTNTLAINGLGTVNIRDTNQNLLLIRNDGVVVQAPGIVDPTYFYLPPASVPLKPGTQKLNIYEIYRMQFQTTVFSSTGATLPV